MANKSTGAALFSLRLSLFILMIAWASLKVFIPASYGGSVDSPGIFGNFYGADVGHAIVIILGIIQIILLLAFVAGLFKTITYGSVLLMNAVTLAVSLPLILNPLEKPNLLFLASVPILGASIALFLMRKEDTFLTMGK